MAKICPETEEVVLYMECNECEKKRFCKPGAYTNKKPNNLLHTLKEEPYEQDEL